GPWGFPSFLLGGNFVKTIGLRIEGDEEWDGDCYGVGGVVEGQNGEKCLGLFAIIGKRQGKKILFTQTTPRPFSAVVSWQGVFIICREKRAEPPNPCFMWLSLAWKRTTKYKARVLRLG